jgi:broad specificity phosphatase PhoE
MPPIPTTLILIRHGETAMNVENIFRGRTDIPLNANGREQAARLAEALRTPPLAAVYSSPMDRAMATAAPLAAVHGLAVQPAEEFHNICLGVWEGRSKRDVQREQLELWQQWVHDPENIRIPGGETLADLRDRVRAGLGRVLAAHPGGTAAVVSHRSVLKVALAEILGLRERYFWKFYLDNCAYSVVEHRSDIGFTLTRLNEGCHLGARTEELF